MNRSKLTYSEKQHLFINVSIGLLLVSNIYFILSCHLCIVKTLQFETIVLWYKLPLYLKSKSILNAKLSLKANSSIFYNLYIKGSKSLYSSMFIGII